MSRIDLCLVDTQLFSPDWFYGGKITFPRQWSLVQILEEGTSDQCCHRSWLNHPSSFVHELRKNIVDKSIYLDYVSHSNRRSVDLMLRQRCDNDVDWFFLLFEANSCIGTASSNRSSNSRSPAIAASCTARQ